MNIIQQRRQEITRSVCRNAAIDVRTRYGQGGKIENAAVLIKSAFVRLQRYYDQLNQEFRNERLAARDKANCPWPD